MTVNFYIHGKNITNWIQKFTKPRYKYSNFGKITKKFKNTIHQKFLYPFMSIKFFHLKINNIVNIP